ncbi:hypothetical protein ABT275_46260 [Streptomyces sp. NPDC001185]|uniref:hypothetical protein n=1 Tax=Streptomyces sp. NPDC001185 TaxID=3154380 RepID=UPI003327477D
MSTMTKRLSIALASTALAGGALLGAGGPASAATASVPAQHTQYVSAQAADHKSEATSFHGVTATRWYQDQVEEATSAHDITVARWHQDQIEEATSSYRVSAARWYLDQIAWSLNHG